LNNIKLSTFFLNNFTEDYKFYKYASYTVLSDYLTFIYHNKNMYELLNNKNFQIKIRYFIIKYFNNKFVKALVSRLNSGKLNKKVSRKELLLSKKVIQKEELELELP
jgi:hypothetical protein